MPLDAVPRHGEPHLLSSVPPERGTEVLIEAVHDAASYCAPGGAG